jgi:hypothetical protein
MIDKHFSSNTGVLYDPLRLSGILTMSRDSARIISAHRAYKTPSKSGKTIKFG